MTKKRSPFKLIDYKLLLSSIPYMDEKKVSEVSRGIVPSKQTNKGFTQEWIDMRGSPAILNKKNGYKEQTWAERRNSFIRRHMGQVKANNEKLFKNGKPTRRHLSLISWGYTPQKARLQRWSRSQPSPYMGLYKMFIG